MARSSRQELIDRLAAPIRSHSGLDLSGADLSGLDLSNQTFVGCALVGADLSRCRLQGAEFRYLDAAGSDWRGSDVERARFAHCDLTCAQFREASLRGVQWRYVEATRAVLENADFRSSMLNACTLAEATFGNANLETTLWRRVHLAGADLDAARDFFINREVVVEILSREIGANERFAMLAGAVQVLGQRCWPDWVRVYGEQPSEAREWVQSVFQRYPASGCLEALLGHRAVPSPG